QMWVGGKDLAITFVVTDAVTGEPVAGAILDIRPEEYNEYTARGDKPFELVTDAAGLAQCVYKNCNTSGMDSLWKHSFHLYVPGWSIRARAPGYSESEPIYLNSLQHGPQVCRGQEVATLTLPVILHPQLAHDG